MSYKTCRRCKKAFNRPPAIPDDLCSECLPASNKDSTLVVIMRRPCVMEDEGHHHMIQAGVQRGDALDWIAAQKTEYFKPSDYYLAETS